MSWQSLPPDIRKHAEKVCTPAELDALLLAVQGMSPRSIAVELGISRSAVRDRLQNAHRKLALARKDVA